MEKLLIKDLFDIRKGRKEKETKNVGIRYIQIEDLRSENNVKYCQENDKNILVNNDDIVIAWDGANAGIVGFNLNGAIGSTLGRLRLKEKLDSTTINTHYIGYFLKFKENYIKENTTGATIPHVSRTVLENIEVNLPPINIQNKIVDILNKLMNTTLLRQQQIEALSDLKQSIFLDMFGDPLKNEQNMVKFEDVIIDLKYGASTPPEFSDKGYKFIRATNIKLGQITEENMMFINEKEAKKLEKCKLDLGDIIFVRSGVNAGDNAIITEEFVGHYGAYDIIVKPNQKDVNPYYLNALFNSHYLNLIIKPLTRRAGQPHINAKQIKSLNLSIPPIELQKQYEVKVRRIIQQIKTLNESMDKIKLLYDSLLHKAFNGELFKEELKV